MTTLPKQTPLWGQHVQLGARLIEFGGWMMPVQYEGIQAEHVATRTGVTVFDTCHMGRFRFEGSGALDGLSQLLSQDLRSLRDGACRYGFLLNDKGGILDDTIIYRIDAQHWMLVVNAGTLDKDCAWIMQRLSGDVRFEDVSARLGKLDVQGPRALDAVSTVLGRDLTTLSYFRFVEFMRQGDPITVSRTGYTGEKGVEIYASAERIVPLWDELLAAGVKPAGLGARDTLRLEAGLPLYGHELGEDVTPVEAGMERYAAKDERFLGREAMLRRLAAGPVKRLCGFRTEGRQAARAGHRVLVSGQEAGLVTSGSFAPTLQCAIGFAYVTPPHAVPGTRVTIDTGRAMLAAEIVRMPLYSAVK
ncbi:MAG: glycine cleavage system aminomethyltransferase GcvT [bacterium]